MFEVTLTVGPSDIDELGHLNNVRYVQWVQDVAVAHSESVGLAYAAYVRLGGVFVMRRHEADYLRSILEGATLRARTWLSNVRAVQVDRHIELLEHEQVVFRSLTRWAWIEAGGRPGRIPAPVREAFASSFTPP
jgi:acyl-CoA thioester hydrolase